MVTLYLPLSLSSREFLQTQGFYGETLVAVGQFQTLPNNIPEGSSFGSITHIEHVKTKDYYEAYAYIALPYGTMLRSQYEPYFISGSDYKLCIYRDLECADIFACDRLMGATLHFDEPVALEITDFHP